MEEEKIREKIAQAIHDTEYPNHPWKKWEKLVNKARYLKMADAILSLDGIRIECSNQDLPENSEPNPPDDREEIIAYQAYNSAQQDMLTPKDGKVWVQCLVKEEK